MSNSIKTPRPENLTLKLRFPRRRVWLPFFLLLALVVSGSLLADQADDQYVQVFNIIDQADLLNKMGQKAEAVREYKQAQNALLIFQKNHPTWEVKVVSYRLSYVADKIADLTQPKAAPGAGTNGTASAAAVPQAGQASKLAAGSPKLEVKLLNAGAEPRRTLRIHTQPGDIQTLDITTRVATDAGLGQSVKLPAMRTVLEVTVKSVSPDGDIAYGKVIRDANVDDEPGVTPQIVEALRTAIRKLAGLTGSGTVSSRGFDLGSKTKIPAGTVAQMRASIEQMMDSVTAAMVPLPEDPVGPGAKWEVRRLLKSQGMTVNETTTYELVSIKGDVLNVTNTVTQHAANQQMQSPAMPGLKVQVTDLKGNGSGDATVDLAHLFPTTAMLNSHSEISMGVNVGGKKQPMSLKTDFTVHLKQQ